VVSELAVRMMVLVTADTAILCIKTNSHGGHGHNIRYIYIHI
jgi:hypothetical protein